MDTLLNMLLLAWQNWYWHCRSQHVTLKALPLQLKGTPHQPFKSYLTGRQQYTTINHQKSGLSNIKYGVQQGSVLGPLLFLLYINDLNKAVVHSQVHHFADDTNFLYASHSLKNLNKTVNFDLSNLVQWLRANKISLNVNKTE